MLLQRSDLAGSYIDVPIQDVTVGMLKQRPFREVERSSMVAIISNDRSIIKILKDKHGSGSGKLYKRESQ